MFGVYKQLHPPTTVNCSVKAAFTSPNDVNLIISKANILELYTLKQRKEGTTEDFKTHLVLTRVFEFYGNIMSLCAVRFPGNTRDALLISFEEEAKVSVVEYDPANNDLRTLSLHYFEDDYLKVCHRIDFI
jgi:cleavage and polyadenylation specificity factor subunit 1